MREIQHRRVQHAAFAQEERNQQPPDAAVAVEEGMNRLELRMREPDLDEQWQVILPVQKRLEVAEGPRHFVRRWGNEGGVLTATQLARCQMRSADALQQLSVDLADEARRDGKVVESREAVVHRAHVVHNLGDVERGL